MTRKSKNSDAETDAVPARPDFDLTRPSGISDAVAHLLDLAYPDGGIADDETEETDPDLGLTNTEGN